VKQQILELLLAKLGQELASLESAFQASKSLATDQEFKAESKYDTRALEASYLASAEQRRIEELKLDIQMLNDVDLSLANNSSEVGLGSLVKLEFNGQVRSYFLVPTNGGEMFSVGEDVVLVISVFSPIGSSMMGLGLNEEFEVETPKAVRNYRIQSIS